MDPVQAAENIHFLEQAMRADFANPLNALARIQTAVQWERYRNLFYTQVCLRMIENYLIMANAFDKQTAFFYNAPWQRENLESLKKAEEWYKAALAYWDQAKLWSEKAAASPLIQLEEIRFWIDQSDKIQSGELNYEAIIQRHLTRLERVRADFEAMNRDTY